MRPEDVARRIVREHIRPGESSPQILYDRKRTEMILAEVLQGPHGTTVEIGSGYGATTRCASKIGSVSRAVGFDADPSLLRKSRAPGYAADFVQGNAERGLPFRPASVDCMIASEVYEHLYRPSDFLREAHRVLRPEGRLLLTTPNTESLVLMFLRRLPLPWARRILTREGERRKYLHPEFFGDVMADSVHGHRIEGASLQGMSRVARDHGFRQVRGTTWGLPFSHGFWGGLPRSVWTSVMDRLHSLGVGLRHVMVVWEKP